MLVSYTKFNKSHDVTIMESSDRFLHSCDLHYDTSFKLTIIKYAQEAKHCMASRKYSIPGANEQEWKIHK
jgi:hypothetical protein